VTRLLLLFTLGVVTWIYFPESRVYAASAVRPVLTPVFRWQTRQEMTTIAHELQLHEREGYGQLPDSRRFKTWLETSFTGEATVDSWGTPYSLMLQKDSFAVVSWGPDGLPDTGDDLQVGRRRAGLSR
jgi:hypothetical protein